VSINLIAGLNHNLLTLDGLKNGADGAFVNTATVTATVKYNDQSVLTSVAMSYVAGSSGSYQVLLDAALNFVEGQYYSIQINADAGGLNAVFERRIKAQPRK